MYIKEEIFNDIENTKKILTETNITNEDLLNLVSIYMLILRSYKLNEIADEIMDFYYQTKQLNTLVDK